MRFLALVFCLPLLAAAAEKDPRPYMHVFAKEIAALQRYIFSEGGFTAPENSGKIEESLHKITEHAKSLQGKVFKEDPALKTNADLLAAHMSETERLFKSGNKPFARFMAQSSMQMCIACHTREKSFDFALPEAELEGLSPLDKANFYFATRQFEKGKEIYVGAVGAYPGNGISAMQLRSSLLALAVYFAKVKEEPAQAAAYFEKIAARKDLPPYLQSEAKAWARDFKDWSAEKAPAKAKPTELVLIGRAKQILAADDFSLIGDSDRQFHIRRLRASSLLHQVLEAPGDRSPAKAQALLLLGQIYQRVSYNLFFRFGEMYLKTCIQEYKKTREAKNCYDALEQMLSEGYTGSLGTNVPEDEQVELFRLKRLAY
jgi:hypothetical protein